jgi:hypothetical protein
MAKLSDDEQKAVLLGKLRTVRERILALASSLPEEKHHESYLGTWSVMEMLAHLAGWDQTNAASAREILAGELPAFYEHAGGDWAEYNAMLVARYSKEDLSDAISLVRATHAKMLEDVEGIPADELLKDRGIRAKGWKVTIARLLEAELQDEEKHLLQLKAFAEEGIKS